ncbi:MAG: hypothetical protein ACRC6X_04510 [Culicoidibacterales bacterium]
MKNLSRLLLALTMCLIVANPLSASGESTVITAINWDGTKKEIVVTQENTTKNMFSRAHHHGFTKSCNDWQGWPYSIKGMSNGHEYTVYRQYFTNNNSQAYYSGWLYA